MTFWREKKKSLSRHYIWVCSSYFLANYLLNNLNNMFSSFRIAQEYLSAVTPTKPFLFFIHMTIASRIHKGSIFNFVINYQSYLGWDRYWSTVRGLNLQKALWNTGYTTRCQQERGLSTLPEEKQKGQARAGSWSCTVPATTVLSSCTSPLTGAVLWEEQYSSYPA